MELISGTPAGRQDIRLRRSGIDPNRKESKDDQIGESIDSHTFNYVRQCLMAQEKLYAKYV